MRRDLRVEPQTRSWVQIPATSVFSCDFFLFILEVVGFGVDLSVLFLVGNFQHLDPQS